MDLLELGNEIARHLNVTGAGAWHVFKKHHWVQIMWGERYGYCLTHPDPKRYIIRGYLPDRDSRGGYVNALNYYAGELPAAITVSITKSPERIAREIESRLEPKYIVQHKKTMAVLMRTNAHIEGQNAIAEVLKPFGVQTRFQCGSTTDVVGTFDNGTLWIFKDSVRFRDLEVTPEQAIDIFKLLQQPTDKKVIR